MPDVISVNISENNIQLNFDNGSEKLNSNNLKISKNMNKKQVENYIFENDEEAAASEILKLEQEKNDLEAQLKSVSYIPESSARDAIIELAKSYLGYPYIFGAKGPDAFDCSGFVNHIFSQLGIPLPGATWTQVNSENFEEISVSDLKKGDVIYNNDMGHVEIYLGKEDSFFDNNKGFLDTIGAQNESVGVAYGSSSWSTINACRRAITDNFLDNLNNNSDYSQFRDLCYTDDQRDAVDDIQKQISEINNRLHELRKDDPNFDEGNSIFHNLNLANSSDFVVDNSSSIIDDTASSSYVVQSGDTLQNIAEKYLGDANRYQEIADLNKIDNASFISVGQALKLPDK